MGVEHCCSSPRGHLHMPKTDTEVDKRWRVTLVPHTHWDREWYLTREQSQVLLADLMEDVLTRLGTDHPDALPCLMLDGQAVVFEDYLATFPSQRASIQALVLANRLQVGPWYVLSDLFVVDAEAIVRNLQLGMRLSKELGRTMPIAYIPDQFGTPAQMPQILSGLGLSDMVVSRGVSLPRVGGSEFWFEGPDGSRVLAILMPRAYINAAALPEEETEATTRLQSEIAFLSEWARTRNLLLMSGHDEQMPQPHLARVVRDADAALVGCDIRIGTLSDHIAGVRRASPNLQVVRGDLRSHEGLTCLPGTLSSRMYIKQANRRTEDLLLRWAEPWSAMAWRLGQSYPRELMARAWRLLLQCHPHDSISGACLDVVHEEMMTRFARSGQIAEMLADRAMSIMAHSVARKHPVSLVVFNPLGFDRQECISARVYGTGEWAENVRVQDCSGNDVPAQVTARGSGVHLRPEYHKEGGSYVSRGQWVDITLIGEVPACGYATFSVSDGALCPSAGLSVSERRMENDWLVVELERGGTLRIMDKSTGFVYAGCNELVDGGDAGNVYLYMEPQQDYLVSSTDGFIGSYVEEQGPARGVLRLDYCLEIPERMCGAGRSQETGLVAVQSRVTLGAAARRVEIATTVVNSVRDHRLRAIFPSGVSVDYAEAESSFHVISRPNSPPDLSGWPPGYLPNEPWFFWPPDGTHPQRSFVDVSDGTRGLAVLNRGLPEYEIIRDSAGHCCIALTLLRCVGIMWQRILPLELPGAQCEGSHTLRYAVYPHAGNWNDATVWREAHGFNTAPKAIQVGPGDGSLTPRSSFLRVEPTNVILTALKQAETGTALVARVLNLSPRMAHCQVSCVWPLTRAFLADLSENPREELETEGESVVFELGAWQLATVLLETERQASG